MVGIRDQRMIADPFRLLDCCLQRDGVCAVVVTSAERARSLRQPPAYILGAAQGTGFLPCAGHNRPDLQILTQGQHTAREVFRVVVELDDAPGVRMASNMVDCRPAEVECGMRVSVVWEDLDDKTTLYKFRPRR